MFYAGTLGAENIAPEIKVSPGNASLKAKLMSIFCRSITAANSFPATLQCIFGCMYGMQNLFFFLVHVILTAKLGMIPSKTWHRYKCKEMVCW